MNDYIQSATFETFAAFTRISTCFLILPGFGSIRIPPTVRLVFVVTLTGVATSIVSDELTLGEQSNPASLVKILFFEALTGVLLGLGARLYILAVSFIGTAASSLIGFNALAAPSLIENEMEPALATLLSFSALMMIMTLDFHHDAIKALIGSFEIVPLGASIPFNIFASNFLSALADSFLVVLRLGSPFIAYALISNLFVALLNKLTPALQLYFVATPVIVMGGLLLAYFVLPLFLSLAGQSFQPMVWRP